MKNLSPLFFVLVLAISCGQTEQTSPQKEEAELIDRKEFFGNPEKIQVRISPDGKYFSYRAPVNGVMNVWAAPIESPENAQPVTKDTVRGVQAYFWTYNSGKLIYQQDLGGDESFHVNLVDVTEKTVTDLTPYEEIIGIEGIPLKDENDKIVRPRANILNVSRDTPNEILVQMNLNEGSNMDVHKIDLETKKMTLVEKDDAFRQIVADNENNVRLATKTNPEGGQIVYKLLAEQWVEYFQVPQEDMLTFGFFGFDKSNNNVYMIDSRGRDKAALYSLNLTTDEKKLIASSEKADIGNVLVNPISNEIDAYSVNYLTNEWFAINENIEDDINYLKNFKQGDLGIYFRTNDDNTWIVGYDSPKEFLKYYKYDRNLKEATFLVASKPKFDEFQLSQTYPVEIESRDGNTLPSYLTLPDHVDDNGKSKKQLPSVLLVHGGPWARDSYGFNTIHQWLANRGYAVLSVNYRGSTGFGKNFINIAAEEWAGKMHDDLIDAANWMVEEGIADKEKVAIMGGSYGGYATLVGLTFTPDVFACGVDIVGPSNLNTLLSTIPPYWKSFRDVFTYHIGDPETIEGAELLKDRSPLYRVDNIVKPLLIGQGANDPRVKQAESDQIVEAMQARNIPVTYILYPDEGHGFARPENNLSFFAVTELFLAKHLGGKSQEIAGAFEGSSIEIVDAGNLAELEK